MALGADRNKVVRTVVSRGLILTLIGITTGLPLAVVLARSLASISYGVKAAESTLFFSCAAIITLISLLACAVPAKRATQVEPVAALRSE
jgi:ABC-type antimicrobial peptide transport system permease subunit